MPDAAPLEDSALPDLARPDQAIAEANTVIAKSITKELISYKSIEKWSGAYPKLLMQGNDSGTILQLPKVDEQ